MARSKWPLHQIGKAKTRARISVSEPGPKKFARFQDAVYREMFLLEAGEPGSEMGLALAMLRAVAASSHSANSEEIRKWLSELCPICLEMIESALASYGKCPIERV